ncbi:hypothetical protein ACIHDR_24180 [Nocardia sp. NPDC052278]|uniref:hypothetical protein n=1 Tax=unclassified Nocardia TaxID=2637762 RepID=UPI0036C376DD
MFIDGYGAGLLNFTPQPITSPVLVLIIAIIYSLPIDYEVFLHCDACGSDDAEPKPTVGTEAATMPPQTRNSRTETMGRARTSIRR